MKNLWMSFMDGPCLGHFSEGADCHLEMNQTSPSHNFSRRESTDERSLIGVSLDHTLPNKLVKTLFIMQKNLLSWMKRVL